MEAYEVAPDLWVWTGRLEQIGSDVASVYLLAGREIVLIDPILPPEDPEGFWAALDRDVVPIEADVHVLLTAASHTRNAREMLERYPGGRLWAARDATAAVESHGVAVTDPFAPGDTLPGGVSAHASGKAGEVVFWLPAQRALVVGNVLFAGDDGRPVLCPEKWLPEGTTQEDLRVAVRPLLELAPELLLLSHGKPVLEQAGDALRPLLAG